MTDPGSERREQHAFHQSLELKLRSVQEALELVLDVARDRRLVLLEATIVVLIVFEILLTFVRH